MIKYIILLIYVQGMIVYISDARRRRRRESFGVEVGLGEKMQENEFANLMLPPHLRAILLC